MKNKTRQLLNSAVLETLEIRQMMSTAPSPAISLHGGVLAVNGGTTQANRVMIDLANNGQQLTVDVSGQHETFTASQVTQLDITTGSGADYIYINPAIDIPENIHSGDGNDTIRGGGGAESIIVGNGNDWISAKGDSNYIQAGSGDDTLLGDKANNTLIAGNGNDYLSSGGRADHLTVGNGNDTFDFGDGHDTITVGTGHNVMIGGMGNSDLVTKNSGGSSSSGSGTTSRSSTGTSGTSGSTTGTSGSSTGSTGTSGTSTGSTGTTSGSNGSTTTAGSGSGTTTNSTIPVTVPANERPTAIFNTMAGPRITGMVVNVDGLPSKVGSGTSITTNYAWDFDDPTALNNQMTGFNAAHVYDQAGTYNITLTVTNNLGAVSVTRQQVTIAASARSQIYVDSQNGSDSNNGSANAPLKSLVAAFSRLSNNTEILLKAGDTFYSNQSLHVNSTDVLIGRYGTGANPQIMRTIGNGLSTIASFDNTNGMTIQDITFNSPYPAATVQLANKIGVGGVYLGGQNLTVRDCTFLNVDDAINENGNPTGVLIQGNSAPQAIGLRGYMIWGQGSHQVIIGNYAANTTKEHIVRLVGLDEVTVENNNFTNHDGKGCIEMHEGEYGWIVGNTVDGGDIRVGPLGLWGEAASSSTDNVVIEDNQLTDTFIYVQSGTHHAMIADNVIIRSGVQAIAVSGVDSQLRTSEDITIEDNTAIDTGTSGNFLNVGGWVSGIVLKSNLWIAPNLKLGSYGSAPVYVDDNNLGCFTQISGNIWPSPISAGTYAQGGINFVGTAMTSSGYLSPLQWNDQSNVGTDLFDNLSLNGSYQAKIGSVVAGAPIKMAA